MSEVSPLNGKDLTFKPTLTAVRKIGGRYVHEELEAPTSNDEDDLEGLLDGVDGYEVEEGRRRLMAENPHVASMEIHNMLDIDAGADEIAQQFSDPVRIAASRRIGKIADKDSGEMLNFKRVAGGLKIELSNDNGQCIQTLSSKEFEDVLRSGSFDIL